MSAQASSKVAPKAAAAASGFGSFVLDSAFLLRFVRRNPQVVAFSTTGIVCTGMYVRNVQRCQQRLLETQGHLLRESHSAADEASKKLEALQNQWSADGERKDQQLTRLHHQNIQQTRSLDRIMTMLQSCRVEVPNLPTFSRIRYHHSDDDPFTALDHHQPTSRNSSSSSPSSTPLSPPPQHQQQQQQHNQKQQQQQQTVTTSVASSIPSTTSTTTSPTKTPATLSAPSSSSSSSAVETPQQVPSSTSSSSAAASSSSTTTPVVEGGENKQQD